MAAPAPLGWIGVVLRRLPAPLIAALDGWSLQLARRKAEARRRKAIQAKRMSTPA